METPLTRGDMLQVDLSTDGLCLAGDVDLAAMERLREGLAGVQHGAGDVHLHLGDVTFIDVGGATAIVRLASALAPDRGIVLHDPPLELRRILELMFGVPDNVQLM